jgi:hypothetical protein
MLLINNFSFYFQLLVTNSSLRLPLNDVLSHGWIVNNAVRKAEKTSASQFVQKSAA